LWIIESIADISVPAFGCQHFHYAVHIISVACEECNLLFCAMSAYSRHEYCSQTNVNPNDESWNANFRFAVNCTDVFYAKATGSSSVGDCGSPTRERHFVGGLTSAFADSKVC
jgi:hypothetical protein